MRAEAVSKNENNSYNKFKNENWTLEFLKTIVITKKEGNNMKIRKKFQVVCKDSSISNIAYEGFTTSKHLSTVLATLKYNAKNNLSNMPIVQEMRRTYLINSQNLDKWMISSGQIHDFTKGKNMAKGPKDKRVRLTLYKGFEVVEVKEYDSITKNYKEIYEYMPLTKDALYKYARRKNYRMPNFSLGMSIVIEYID